MSSILSQFLFYFSIIIVLFLPGYSLLMATNGKKYFSPLESFLVAFGSSIAIIDFLMILIGKSGIGITQASVIGTIISFCAICYAIHFYTSKKIKEKIVYEDLSKRSAFIVILLVFLTIFIKTIYLQDTIPPTSTDLGHHMYWAKQITITGTLPVYEKADIGSDFTIGDPQPIADFIIGEHLIFSAIALISGTDFISAFPSLTLLYIHVLSILAIFILSHSLFKKSEYRDQIALMALFLIGPLYALASPQAKYVSGGVIGNDIGNLFIPLAIFLYARAITEKKSLLLAWGIFISLGLAYTHHLSTFIFIFIFLFTSIAFFALNFKTIIHSVQEWIKLLISPSVLAILAISITFIFFIYTPTYLNTKAIDTAVGAPSKLSRAGLTITQLKTTAGEARFVFALVGFIFLFFARKIGKYNQAFLIGWIGSLALMSLFPDLLFIDIPSNRIASYIVFPSAVVAAYTIISIFTSVKTSDGHRNYLHPVFTVTIFFVFMAFISTDGFFDNSRSLSAGSSVNGSIQTYAASKYLSERSSSQDIILKDHNYLSGDSWIKLFFMRGYNYPLSRGYFKRYQDETKPREQCTNLMISLPNNPEAKQCFSGTKTNFIILNPKTDSAQFRRLKNFWQIYSSDEVVIFHKSS